MSQIRYLGIDLGTKRGAMVELGPENNYRVLSSWTRGPKVKEFDLLVAHMEEILSSLPQGPGHVAVDWSPFEVFMRGNRVATQMKAFCFGYLYKLAIDKDLKVAFMTPAQVREYFNLNTRADKLAVQSTFKQAWDGPQIRLKNEHELDALIIAWILKKKNL